MQIRIGNAAGFAGDNLDAPRLIAETGQLDYLTLEYLAELTLSVLAYQKSRDPSVGFIQDVPVVARDLADVLKAQNQLRLITNGGGMNPRSCARTVAEVFCDTNLADLAIAACSGDDLLPRISELMTAGEEFRNLETDEPLDLEKYRVASANAYLGCAGIVSALAQGARAVITGRIADASLVTGPLVHEFGWAADDWNKLGRATVAGHLIECGAQATGGMFSDWSADQAELASVGYPIAIVDNNGDCTITKTKNSGGLVSRQTVAEQLVYEIGDPQNYLTPDVIADFANVTLEETGTNQVRAQGGAGKPAPETYKVSLAYHDGYAISGMIVFCGPNAVANARAGAEMVRQRTLQAGFDLDHFEAEVLGAGDTMRGCVSSDAASNSPWDVVLRVAARDHRREAVNRVGRELAPLVTSGPPGVTGYTGSRPKSHPVLAFWPTTVHREHIEHQVVVKTAKEWLQ